MPGGDEHTALLARVPAILYIAEPGADGVWHYVSPQIEPLLGFSPEEWLADPEMWSQRLHPADRDAVLAREHERLALGTPDPAAVEYRMVHRNGDTVWLRDDALLIPDEDGGPRWHGVLSDITDRKHAEAELERRVAQQAAVARLGEHALEGVAIEELLQEAVTAAAELLDMEAAFVVELLPDGATLQLRAAYGWPSGDIGGRRSETGRGSQVGYTLSTGAPVVVSDWASETRFAMMPPARDQTMHSSITVQIEGAERPFGVLGAGCERPRAYTPGDVDFIQALANVLADTVERQRTEEAIQHRALHDPLTGLPNRVLFLDRLEQALERLRRRRRGHTAVLFIDVDHFKLVNDSLGHHAGDELLAAVAGRLREAVRPTDTVARFGGDEFGLLLEDVHSERDAITMAERLAAGFARPFVLDAGEHFVTTSIGIALADGREQTRDLIRDADAAMYRAKERGRARYELFDEDMRARALARLRLENDLRRALDNGELRLTYQPLVSLRDESIVGVEALLRWDHPQRGVVMPDEFIPVAEENGLIDRIGQWVLEEACREGAAWAQARPDAAPLVVSVNLSPLQLAGRRFPEVLAEILLASGMDATALSLEITESLLLEESGAIRDTLRLLKSFGVRIVLDDFGTGYSSLGYLTRLPLDVLKVDRSFVANLGGADSDTAITEAVIGMARALGLEVVGEGAETQEQVVELRRLGCDFVQGYLFSQPISAAEITELLQQEPYLRRTID